MPFSEAMAPFWGDTETETAYQKWGLGDQKVGSSINILDKSGIMRLLEFNTFFIWPIDNLKF